MTLAFADMVILVSKFLDKIFHIEDDLQLQVNYQENFQKLGVEVLLAITGAQGLQLAKEQKPDLILLDIMLPLGLNGFDVLESLKRDPELKNIPVIVITNLDSERKTAMDIGATDYIVKANTSLEDVISRVKQLLGI